MSTQTGLNQPANAVRKPALAKDLRPSASPYKAAIELINADTASQYLQSNNGNRSIKKGAVAYFAALMEKGAWILSSDAIAFDKRGRLLNGQHRLTAVAMTGIAQHFVVVRGLDPSAFEHIDTGNRRGLDDVLDIMGVPHAKTTAAIAKRVATYAKAGYLTPSTAPFGRSSSAGGALFADRADELHVVMEFDEIPRAAELALGLAKGGRRLGITPTAIGFIYLLYKNWHPGIESFLQRTIAISPDSRGEGDPAKRLALRLLDGVQGLEVDSLSPAARIGYILLAANADFKGRQLSKLQWTHKDKYPQPLVHVATDWAKRLGWPAPKGAAETGEDDD